MDSQILCYEKISIDGFWPSEIVKYPVGSKRREEKTEEEKKKEFIFALVFERENLFRFFFA